MKAILLATVVALAACGGCDEGGAGGPNSGTSNSGTPNSMTPNSMTPNSSSADGGANSWQGTDGGPIQGGEVVVVTDPGGEEWSCVITTCNDKLLECGNCEDDDGDGFVDAHDRECLGPCDNTEGPALTAGVGGEGGGPCKADCYFDFGNGSGNDDCHWDHQCDPLSVGPNFHPEGPDCEYDPGMLGGKDCPTTQSGQCFDFCRPLTPNGCDCFGCCTFPELNGSSVWIGSMDDDKNGTCTFADILDTSACEPCTPVADCANDCQRCELCIGKDTVPDDCFVTTNPDMGPNNGPDGGGPADGGGGGVPTNPGQCPGGEIACGLAGQPNCPTNHYCISGCCQRVLN